MAKRGAKVVSDRDWLFGSRPRRLALVALLDSDPSRLWSKADLARAAQVSPNGGVDEHVAGFERLGLVEPRRGGYALVDPGSGLVRNLRALLRQLDALPDERAGAD